MPIFHSVQLCAKSRSIFRDFKSLSKTRYQVFWGLPFSISPINKYISAFLHHAIITTVHLSIWVKPPQSVSSNAVPNAIKAKTLPQFWRMLPILQLKVTLHIHLIIHISLCSNLNKSASFTAQVYYHTAWVVGLIDKISA